MEHLVKFVNILTLPDLFEPFDLAKVAHFFLLRASTTNALKESRGASHMHSRTRPFQDVPITLLQDTNL